ncbi:hypothetical protein [Prescottella subtropica]|uniref:hypothetical protein n=1 Tax=Prescottella subtropica TaxID=2545757 RepID=UPI0010F867DB|nr:hypothetical protein [Prescottella subtropica]
MSTRPIIDAGPALNFLAINKERLLFSVLGQISTPETVEQEVLRYARSGTGTRFARVESVWNKLTPKWIQVMSDDVVPDLDAAVARISGLPLVQRRGSAKDLGELMVIAHAVVAAEAGRQVTVIIDDQDGARTATVEMRRLERLRQQGTQCGSITLVNTGTILQRAAGGEYLPDKGVMRDVYRRLRECDDGLPPIERTPLLSTELWR